MILDDISIDIITNLYAEGFPKTGLNDSYGGARVLSFGKVNLLRGM